jgi:hypothetical protein
MNDWLIAIKLPVKKYLSYNETSLPSRVLCDFLSRATTNYTVSLRIEHMDQQQQQQQKEKLMMLKWRVRSGYEISVCSQKWGV